MRKFTVRRRAENPQRELHVLPKQVFGGHSEEDTPVPIPNTEVKPFSADGTAWVTVWESRTLPRLKLVPAKAGDEKPIRDDGLFCSVIVELPIKFCYVYPVRKPRHLWRG